MTLEQIEAYLKANGVTWPIVAHELPPAPERCIAVRKYSGIPGRYRDGNGLPIDDQPRFQILTRDRDDVAAQDMADELHDLLHVRHNRVFGPYVYRVEGEQRPVYMMGRESGLYVYVFNISAWVLR